ncbi:type IV pilus secretin PilQ family protein [Pseudomonas sp. N040]|uniref:type IV pilus secretin PilQ family protein n=1 Tax=Pseudomonas sp. N040 TaxID=2785325 RepID=UPI0018A24DFB|nr:type IV pilus secretin PilQ family protein [Pseudomonas sp. N040]MBF7729883.1 type IV pilus secretin PilQ family protein [Pseudomonas sp. N040]MBW7013525.1 type IV pilus secretin PilQ [Pseudomonas sp. N040]
MNSSLARIGFALLTALTSTALFAADLEAIDVGALPGESVELKLQFDQPVAAPRGYTIEQPARIALDFPGVANKLGQKNREIAVGAARSMTIVETKDRTRLIVNLSTLKPYSVRSEGNSVFVVVGEGGSSASNTVAPSTAAAKYNGASTAAYQPAGKTISAIDFQRGPQGEGNVVIDLSAASISPDITDLGGKIKLEFANTGLPESLRVRLDVQDFATPVRFVSATDQAGKATVVIEPTGSYDYMAYQTDKRLTISVKPLTQAEKAKRDENRFAYTGEKLSLNFQDIDVRSVLQLIADFTDLNLVASDSVQGSITLRLQNVPWDQALDLVLKTKGLDQRKIGNVLLIAPADEIAARERQELESQQLMAELAPLRRELIQVNYAKAADIAKLFESVTAADEEGSGGAAGRGSITVDDRTNSIIAYQTQERLDELRRVVAQLDIPVRQVLIEARIVEADVGFKKDFGVKWRGLSVGDNNWVVGGSTAVRDRVLPDAGGIPTYVDLGAAAPTSGLNLGFITDNTILDLELTAMESTGNGEVISQPKVVTSDKETAKILKGKEIPYQEASSSGATTTQFKEAVLSLEVTPQITPDDQVIMEVKVNKDDIDETVPRINGVPSLKTNEVNAKVLVRDGETIVIGGVFSTTQSKTVEKVPFLGDLPYLGQLFKNTAVVDQKSELLIFLTPRIMSGSAITPEL